MRPNLTSAHFIQNWCHSTINESCYVIKKSVICSVVLLSLMQTTFIIIKVDPLASMTNNISHLHGIDWLCPVDKGTLCMRFGLVDLNPFKTHFKPCLVFVFCFCFVKKIKCRFSCEQHMLTKFMHFLTSAVRQSKVNTGRQTFWQTRTTFFDPLPPKVKKRSQNSKK